jgi:hypothetical protein
MKRYKLIKNSEICYSGKDTIILNGTEVLSNGDTDEFDGLKTIVDTGKYKGMKITFAKEELEEIKE